MTDKDRIQWRAAGLRSGELYADELSGSLQGRTVDDAEVRALTEMLGVSLQGEALRLREQGLPEELIEDYTKAAIEAVMLRMYAIHSTSTQPDGSN